MGDWKGSDKHSFVGSVKKDESKTASEGSSKAIDVLRRGLDELLEENPERRLKRSIAGRTGGIINKKA